MNEPARSIISKVSPTRHLVPARRIVSTHFRSRPTPNCTVLHGCVQVNQHAKRRKLMPQVPAQGLPREPCLPQEKRRKRRPLQPSLHFERRPSCQTQAEVRRIPTTTDALCMTCPHRRAQEGGEGGSSLFQPDPIETDCNRIDFRSAVLQIGRSTNKSDNSAETSDIFGGGGRAGKRFGMACIPPGSAR